MQEDKNNKWNVNQNIANNNKITRDILSYWAEIISVSYKWLPGDVCDPSIFSSTYKYMYIQYIYEMFYFARWFGFVQLLNNNNPRTVGGKIFAIVIHNMHFGWNTCESCAQDCRSHTYIHVHMHIYMHRYIRIYMGCRFLFIKGLVDVPTRLVFNPVPRKGLSEMCFLQSAPWKKICMHIYVHYTSTASNKFVCWKSILSLSLKESIFKL